MKKMSLRQKIAYLEAIEELMIRCENECTMWKQSAEEFDKDDYPRRQYEAWKQLKEDLEELAR